MERVFISYRRKDEWPVSVLHTGLEKRLGTGAVFRDRSGIEAGDEFWRRIEEVLARCKVMLVVIGAGWIEDRDTDEDKENGAHCEDTPRDYVFMEIEAALKRNVKVIPVLLGNVTMPSANALPDSVRRVTALHAAELRDGPDLETHIDRIAKIIEPKRSKARMWLALAAATALAAAGGIAIVTRGGSPSAGEVRRLELSSSNSVGRTWCRNRQIGEWRPTHRRGNNTFATDDFCWGQVRTFGEEAPIVVGSRVKVKLTPNLESKGDNIDAAFIAFGDYISYGDAWAGFRIDSGMLRAASSDDGDGVPFATYEPGAPLELSLEYHGNDGVTLFAPNGSSYLLKTGTTSKHDPPWPLVFANANSSDGWVLHNVEITNP